MSQIAYGTITITDTNDIESIIVEYARNQNPGSAPESGWSTDRPAWAQSYYIWQRTRTHKAGTETSEDTYGTAVCITGSTGATGAAGRSLSSTVTHYTIATSSATINQSNMGSYTWTTNVPSYNASYPTYWVRVTNTYSNPSSTEYIFYKDQGITDAIKTSNDANITANDAWDKADNAEDIAQQASINVTNLQTRTKYFWTNLTAHTNGTGGWTKPDYPVGTFAASGIDGTTFDYENSSTYGYNTLYSNGIKLRYNAINLGQLTGSSLIFYNPSTSSQGTKAMELSGSSLKFYASDGTTAQAEFGGTQARVEGQLIAQSGYIGTNETNRWFIGNRKNYDQTNSAALLSYGSAYIQLGEDGCWRLSTNRLHTGWNAASGSNVLHYPKWNNIYWDFGIHAPTQNANKFIYIRNYDSTDSGLTEAQILADLQDNFESNVSVIDSWQYRFYVTAEGSLYAKNIYVLDDNGNATQIGGTDGVYLLKSGGTITGNLEVNGTLTKGGKNVAYLTATPTNGQILVADGTTSGIKTSGYTIATSVPQNAIFTDKNVQTNLNNTTKFYLAGPTTTATNTGTLIFDSNVYVDTTAGALHATTFNGYTLAAAAAKGVDTSMTSTSTSTNLPTTKAVADLIATYLPLAGGTVSGAVDINDELYADGATFGNLIVNGVGRFTNGIYGDLIGNVTGSITGNAATADKVNHNLVIKLASGTTEGTNMFTFNGSVAKTVDITKSALGLGNVENKSSATIRGELTSANVTTALGFTPYNSTNPNGYTTNVGTITGVTAGTGLNGGGTSGTVTLNHSNSVTAQTTQGIYPIKIDAQGHISAYGSAPTTLSGYGITDAKIVNGVITLGSNTITPLTSQWTANLYVGKTATDKANAAATNGNVYLNLVENNTVRNAHKITGSGTTTVTSDADGNITISSADSKTGTVTSITLTQGTGITIGSSGTAITTSGSRTISLADNYGDTKNPYASKTARYVLAAPADAAGAPSFRALTGADVGLGNVLDYAQITNITNQTDSQGHNTGKLLIWKGATSSVLEVEITATESSTATTAQKAINDADNDPIKSNYAHSISISDHTITLKDKNGNALGNSITVPDNNTTYTFANGTNGFTVTPSGGTAQTVTITPSIANNITGSGTSGYLAKFNGANTITNGPALGTDTTKFLNNKGEWSVPTNTNTTYTLTNALASHKFTWTFTAGGSGSGSTTTIAELAAGTGISLTDDTNNKKITIGNAGVTGVKGNLENDYRTGQVNLTPANLGAVATTGDETISGKKVFDDILQIKKTIRDSSGQHYYGGAANRSQWYKITLAHNGVTPPSSNQWYMCSMTIHIAGDYQSCPRGTIELCYYIYWNGTTYLADRVYATGYGPQINKAKVYYKLTDPFVIYVDSSNAYTSIWVDYISYRDSAQSHNTKETKVETTSAITVTDYTVVPTSYMYTTDGNYIYASTHLRPTNNNSQNLGDSSYKWANVYATAFNGNATSATTAEKISSLSSSDTASSTTTWRNVWISYNDNTTGRPAITEGLTFQTSTNTLKATTFKGALDGNATSANTATTAGAFSSNASITLTGDTTGSASSTKGWSITTKTDRLSTVGDNRSVATIPNDYANKIIFQGLKYSTTIGISNVDTYSYLIGLRGWADNSGGNAHEIAFNDTNIFYRKGATTTWGNWYQVYTSASTIPVANGGTGTTTFTAGTALIGNGTNAIQTRSITNVTSGAVTASTNLVTANSLVAHVSNALGNYVTIAGDNETVTGTKVFNNLLGTKYVATKGGNGCEINYNSSLEALVFSFS